TIMPGIAFRHCSRWLPHPTEVATMFWAWSRMVRCIAIGAFLAVVCGNEVRAEESKPEEATRPANGNRLIYLDENNPWYPHRDFRKLTTPQWVGESGVECVVVLSIDDMFDTAKQEAYLRPILNRLKAIDGRAPVSIMTCRVKPDDPQLTQWLAEGLSLEA